MIVDPDDDWDDEEWPEDSEEYATIRCPNCGAEIHEDTPRCPVCGDYVTRGGGRVWDGKPAWYVVLGILGIIAVIIVLLRFF